MTAAQDTMTLQQRLKRRGIVASFEQVNTLRRAELTLHHWYELECGDGNHHVSWAIERDEITDKPSMYYHYNDGETRRTPIADRERGAERRIKSICEGLGVNYYIQSDPRGCALYVSTEPMTDSNYSSVGVAVTA